jgi:dihydrolipoamide dehydrogenase
MYDIAILGGGPAGYTAAALAGKQGQKVVLFEKKELGGVCLNEGCIPTKTLLYSAKVLQTIKESSHYGISAGKADIDFSAIMNRKNNVIQTLVKGVTGKMKKNKVEVIKAVAVITGRENGIISLSADGKDFQAKNLLLASGAVPAVPPIPGLEKGSFLTSTEILDLKKAPKSLIIIGGGVIGLEFASFYASMGTQCTVIEMMPEILPGIDKDICEELRKVYTEKGITFTLGAKVAEVKGDTVIYEKDGKPQKIKGEKLLLAIGRKPVTEGYGLEKLGVELEKGGVKIDEKCRTNIPGVYAAGDITGKSLLAHTAIREGETAINVILGKDDNMRYSAIPGVVYTNPEIACVGLTEEEAAKKGIDVQSKMLPMSYAGRFIAENEGKNGFCKITAGKKYGEILGVHMIGSHCSEMIYGACLMIENQLRIDDIKETVFPHPTVSEVIRENIFTFRS